MIRQFDVHANAGAWGDDAPYICVLQSHYLDGLDTIVVAPLLRVKAPSTHSQVAVPVTFAAQPLLVDTSLLANIELRTLGRRVGSLIESEYEIRRALDRLFTGF